MEGSEPCSFITEIWDTGTPECISGINWPRWQVGPGYRRGRESPEDRVTKGFPPVDPGKRDGPRCQGSMEVCLFQRID